MPEQDQDISADDVEDASDAEDTHAPNRVIPISATARFTIGGRPVVLDDFIDITTGDVANRPVVEPRPQPPPLPKDIVWLARRPLDD